MKIAIFNSTLSCINKCIRFLTIMVNKKLVFGLFLLSFLGACASPTAMLGPAYTFSTTGNVLQTGFTYGSSEMVTIYTGKTPIENLKNISLDVENNIQKQTLESDDFFSLVDARIKKTSAILKLAN